MIAAATGQGIQGCCWSPRAATADGERADWPRDGRVLGGSQEGKRGPRGELQGIFLCCRPSFFLSLCSMFMFLFMFCFVFVLVHVLDRVFTRFPFPWICSCLFFVFFGRSPSWSSPTKPRTLFCSCYCPLLLPLSRAFSCFVS